MTDVTEAEVEAAAKAAYFELYSIMHDHEKLWAAEDKLKGNVWRDVARSALLAAARVRAPQAAAEGEVEALCSGPEQNQGGSRHVHLCS